MIFGRPTNLWAGLVTAVLGFASVVAINVLGYDPETVALIIGALTGVLGALIALVAVQPPTVLPNTDVTVQTAKGEPNATATLSLDRSAGDATVVATPTG